jgi:plasmid stabilization system protein ParE
MRVELTPEAAAQLESRKRWWRANRHAAVDLFDRELLEAIALIAERALLLPVAREVRGRHIRRVLMEKTACHLYFEVDEKNAVVTIVSAWGAVRGKGPPV